MTFGDRLKEKLSEAGMTAAELARRSGVTKQNISRILNNTPHSITGALPTVERSTVERLAKGLGWNLDEALFAAGYAPHAAMTKPTTIEELAEALESLGIEMPLFHKVEDIDGEGFAALRSRIRSICGMRSTGYSSHRRSFAAIRPIPGQRRGKVRARRMAASLRGILKG